jgi:hypothetical protein
MLVPVFVFLLVVCPFLCLALLWRHDWFHLRPSSSRGGAKRGTLQTIAPPVVSAPLPRWVEGQLLRQRVPGVG